MTTQPSEVEWARVRQMEVDIVTLAYDERYEASCAAADELVAFAAELLDKYGPILRLLAIRASHAVSERDRLSHSLATYQAAEAAGDGGYQAWAAHLLASHYVYGRIDLHEGERWLALAEQQAGLLGDVEFDDELGRLRGIVEARKRPKGGQPMPRVERRGGRRTNEMPMTRSAKARRRGPRS